MAEPSKIDVHDPYVLDQLVDGELTDAQEREVIAQLDELPDGWRRCALAFLEARCWQRAARQVRELSGKPDIEVPSRFAQAIHNACGETPPIVEAPETTPLAKPAVKLSRSFRWPGALALCALFLLAFGIGTLLPHPWQQAAQQPVAPTNTHLVGTTPKSAEEKTNDGFAPQQEPRPQDYLAGNVTLVDNSGGQLQVPVYDWNQQVAEQLMYRSQPLPPEFLQQLKRHQVRSQRSYLPVTLQDGRRVVVPVDKVEIVPVGGTAY